MRVRGKIRANEGVRGERGKEAETKRFRGGEEGLAEEGAAEAKAGVLGIVMLMVRMVLVMRMVLVVKLVIATLMVSKVIKQYTAADNAHINNGIIVMAMMIMEIINIMIIVTVIKNRCNRSNKTSNNTNTKRK